MHILDTDIASLLYYGRNPKVNAAYNAFPTDQTLALSIVTWCEIIRGRCDRLRKASTMEETAKAAVELERSRHWVARFKIVLIDEKALALFDNFKKSRLAKSIKHMDLLQACIAFSTSATLVSRNTKDFRPLSLLKIENWDE